MDVEYLTILLIHSVYLISLKLFLFCLFLSPRTHKKLKYITFSHVFQLIQFIPRAVYGNGILDDILSEEFPVGFKMNFFDAN